MNMLVSASAVASATLAPSSASAGDDLAALFASLWPAYQIEREADKRWDAEGDALDELVEANQKWPDDQDLWTREDCNAYWEARGAAEQKTELSKWQDATLAAGDVVDGICKQIIERYPATVQALAAQALMAGRANPKVWEHDDYEDVQLHALFSAVFTAAGVECPFKFEAEPKGEPAPEPVRHWEAPHWPGCIASDHGVTPNVPVAIAVAFHRQAVADVAKHVDGDDKVTGAAAEKLCKIENNALRAVLFSYAANLKDAAARAIYVANYWNEQDDHEANAYHYLTGVIAGLRQYLPISRS